MRNASTGSAFAAIVPSSPRLIKLQYTGTEPHSSRLMGHINSIMKIQQRVKQQQQYLLAVSVRASVAGNALYNVPHETNYSAQQMSFASMDAWIMCRYGISLLLFFSLIIFFLFFVFFFRACGMKRWNNYWWLPMGTKSTMGFKVHTYDGMCGVINRYVCSTHH